MQGEYSRRPIDLGLVRLRNMINDMSMVVGKVMKASMEFIESGKIDMDGVRRMSDELLFMMEEVSELAVQLIARFQPVAIDLREIKSAIQVSYDFSRIGRYAVNISETYPMMPKTGCNVKALEEMFKIVLEMVNEAGEAYLGKDLEKAEEVKKRDDEVDALYAEYIKQLIQKGGEIDAGCLLSIALILRYLERIADHACYIADATIYMVKGRK
ncbi:MAG: phosphate signaling complex protein PhoU [Nitrososphaerota archaeon]